MAEVQFAFEYILRRVKNCCYKRAQMHNYRRRKKKSRGTCVLYSRYCPWAFARSHLARQVAHGAAHLIRDLPKKAAPASKRFSMTGLKGVELMIEREAPLEALAEVVSRGSKIKERR